MLSHRVRHYLENELDTEDLNNEISKVIKDAIRTNNVTSLNNFFGVDAFQKLFITHPT